MDAPRFEMLLRSLSASPSRRSTLRLLTGAALGGFLPFGRTETEAHDALKTCKQINNKAKRKQCVKKAKRHNATHNVNPVRPFCSVNPEGASCGACHQCRGGSCVGICTTGHYCDAGTCAPCKNEDAVCASDDECCPFLGTPRRCCSGRCQQVDRDENNCGRCGNNCPDGGGCNNGQCCTRIFDQCTSGGTPCCGAARGVTCNHLSSGEQRCCGIEVHGCAGRGGCTAGAACEWCCSGQCGANGVCTPLL